MKFLTFYLSQSPGQPAVDDIDGGKEEEKGEEEEEKGAEE